MIQKTPSLPRGWNEGVQEIFMIYEMAILHLVRRCNKKGEKIENRSTYRFAV